MKVLKVKRFRHQMRKNFQASSKEKSSVPGQICILTWLTTSEIEWNWLKKIERCWHFQFSFPLKNLFALRLPRNPFHLDFFLLSRNSKNDAFDVFKMRIISRQWLFGKYSAFKSVPIDYFQKFQILFHTCQFPYIKLVTTGGNENGNEPPPSSSTCSRVKNWWVY